MVRLLQTAQFLPRDAVSASGAAQRQGNRQSAEQGNLLTIPNMAHRTNRAPKVVQSDQTSDFATSIMLRNEEVRRAVTKAVRSFVLQVTYNLEITLIVVSSRFCSSTGELRILSSPRLAQLHDECVSMLRILYVCGIYGGSRFPR
jgi:hypothetical protein